MHDISVINLTSNKSYKRDWTDDHDDHLTNMIIEIGRASPVGKDDGAVDGKAYGQAMSRALAQLTKPTAQKDPSDRRGRLDSLSPLEDHQELLVRNN